MAKQKKEIVEVLKNKFYYGDNLDVLRKYIKDETVDLCYIDPPFNSKRNYNQIYNNIGKEDQAQAQAFVDTWTWDESAAHGYDEITTNSRALLSTQTIDLIIGLEKVLGRGSLLSYLVSITLRISEIYRVLKSTGSFYLHCDPTASHYLKIIVDSIFCSQKGIFQNEIIWRRTSSHNSRRSYGPIHDVILFYTKTNNYTFNIVRRPYMSGHVKTRYSLDINGDLKFTSGGNVLSGAGKTNGDSGKPWRGFNPSSKNRHWAVPGFLTEDLDEEFNDLPLLDKLEELYKMGRIEIKANTEWPTPVRFLKQGDGQPIQDIWTYQPYTEGTVYGTKQGIDVDVSWLGTTDPERLGYPTQKPEGLLERLINASTNKGDLILDAYCGCGTTVSVAEKLKRKWIGIDITYQSISLMLKRLEDTFGNKILNTIELNGVPKDFNSAEALAHKKEDKVRKEFEKWAVLTYSNNRAVINDKKGGDGGIDGVGYILDTNEVNKQEHKKIIISVKSDKKLNPTVVRDLNGTIERENAAMGFLLTLYPMDNLVKESKRYGLYKNKLFDQDYQKIQIISAQELLNGIRMLLPSTQNVLKKAKRNNDEEVQSTFGF